MLRSQNAADFVTLAICFEIDTVAQDTLDFETPVAGGIFYYLVRIKNDCPNGTAMGQDSAGTPRVGFDCF